jgi:hypothetical protein
VNSKAFLGDPQSSSMPSSGPCRDLSLPATEGSSRSATIPYAEVIPSATPGQRADRARLGELRPGSAALDLGRRARARRGGRARLSAAAAACRQRGGRRGRRRHAGPIRM